MTLLRQDIIEDIITTIAPVYPSSGRLPRLYLARGMSGRPDGEVAKEAAWDKEFFEACGFTILCPCDAEGVKNTGKALFASKETMLNYWFEKDKPMIRAADVVVNMTPHLISYGVLHEMVLSRGVYWKPTAWLFPKGALPHNGNIVHFEGDLVSDDPLKLAEGIYKLWGTRQKRFMWRVAMLNRCLLPWIWDQVTFLFELPTRGVSNVIFSK